MPRETLRALDRDVERLLMAGAALATHDADLTARATALAGFGARVPALAKLAEGATRVGAAPAGETAGALLDLATLSATVRGAQAAAVRADGALGALPAFAPLETSLSVLEVQSLYEALTGSGSGRLEIVREAIGRGVPCDLRLLHAWIGALGDNVLGDTVAEMLPRYGRAIAGPLAAALDLKGGAAHARRLACLAAVEGRDCCPLLERACAKGSPEVRGTAIEAWMAIEPEAAEPVARTMMLSDRMVVVRRRAVAALGNGREEASLRALLAELDGGSFGDVAARALGTFSHPDTAGQLLARLPSDRRALTEPVQEPLPPDPTLHQRTRHALAYQSALERYRGRLRQLELLLHALARRDEPEVWPRLEALLDPAVPPPVRKSVSEVVADAVSPRGRALAARLLDGPDEGLWKAASSAAILLDPSSAYDRLAPHFTAERLRDPTARRRAECVLVGLWRVIGHGGPAAAVLSADRRWCDALLAALATGDEALGYAATDLAVHYRETRAAAGLVPLLAIRYRRTHVVRALGALGDRSAVPALLAWLEIPDARFEWEQIVEALVQIDDPRVVPALRMRLERDLSASERHAVQAAVSLLGRDRTLG
jgi:HEAT repeat protein